MDTKSSIRKFGIIFIIVISFVGFLLSISTVHAEPNSKIDIRFVVDMSYNMKQNDPNQLRITALKKLISQLPEDARSGIWTYGKYVNRLVPVAPTTSKWKYDAIKKVNNIGGYGAYRDLARAIDEAANGWSDKKGYKKYIVLLTSGDLHVADSKGLNARSQLNLLTNTLPKLKKEKIAVHTVSLSNNADNRLLKILASQTNGKWYSVNDMEYLSNVLGHVQTVLLDARVENSELALKTLEPVKSKNKILLVSKTNNTNNAQNAAKHNKPTKVVLPKHEDNLLNNRKINSFKKPEQSKVRSNRELKLDKYEETKAKLYPKRDEMDFNWPTVYSG